MLVVVETKTGKPVFNEAIVIGGADIQLQTLETSGVWHRSRSHRGRRRLHQKMRAARLVDVGEAGDG